MTTTVPIAGVHPPRVMTDDSAVVNASPGADPNVGITDAGVGRAIAFGFTVGTLAMFLLSLGIGLAAGLGLGEAAAVAGVPGIFGGLFGGGSPALLVQLRRFEMEERRAREKTSRSRTF